MSNGNTTADAIIMELYRLQFAEGDRARLLQALCLCLEENYRIPPWVRDGMLAACRTVSLGRRSSWDSVFGSEKFLRKNRKRENRANQVLLKVIDAEMAGMAIDEQLFEKIGRELSMGGGTARRYYYKYYPSRQRQRKKTSQKSR